MTDCDYLSTCPFFNDRMDYIPEKAEQMKNGYCRRAGEGCARYMVLNAIGRENVPSDLYPMQLIRAEKLISE
ncbi:MAG: hypothetical protein ACMUIG_02490 [Thermoplasmatota archaeon]